MAQRDAFGALLLSLRDAPGLLPRLQRIAGSLGVLKRLGPRQRTVLLRMAGLGGAEPLLEHLIAGDDKTREAFNRLLDDFEERPEKLSEVVRGLLDPVQRPEAAAALVRALEQAVEEEEAGTADEAAGEPARGEDETADEEAETLDEAETPEGVDMSPAAPETAARSAPPAPEEPEPSRASPPAPPSGPLDAPPPQPPPVIPVAAAAAALHPLPGEPEPPRRLPRPEEVRPTTPPAVESSSAEEARAPEAPGDQILAGQPLPEEEPPTARPESADERGPIEGWDLRSRLEAGEAISVADLAMRLHDEAPPWTRRRTLQTWIESASPFELTSSLDRVLELIRDLETTPDRMWCLTSLAGSRPWDDQTWQRILATAETPSLRRRLVHRRLPSP